MLRDWPAEIFPPTFNSFYITLGNLFHIFDKMHGIAFLEKGTEQPIPDKAKRGNRGNGNVYLL